MSISFVRPKAHFLKTNRSVPNTLIFDENLSDSAIRLLLALNGLPENWTIIQADIMKRLCWSPKKMRKVIKECVDNGFMQTKQNRSQKGTFGLVTFEFSLEPEFLKNKVPSAQKPHAVEPPAVNGHPAPIYSVIVDNSNVVVCVPPPELGDDTTQHAKKEKIQVRIEKKEFLEHCVGSQWTIEEVDAAWEDFQKTEKPITNQLKYLDGILRNKRRLSIFNKPKNKVYKKETKCNQTKNQLKKESVNSNSQIMASDTSEKPFQDWKFQVGLEKKSSLG